MEEDFNLDPELNIEDSLTILRNLINRNSINIEKAKLIFFFINKYWNLTFRRQREEKRLSEICELLAKMSEIKYINNSVVAMFETSFWEGDNLEIKRTKKLYPIDPDIYFDDYFERKTDLVNSFKKVYNSIITKTKYSEIENYLKAYIDHLKMGGDLTDFAEVVLGETINTLPEHSAPVNKKDSISKLRKDLIDRILNKIKEDMERYQKSSEEEKKMFFKSGGKILIMKKELFV